jgi:hypothetical protein
MPIDNVSAKPRPDTASSGGLNSPTSVETMAPATAAPTSAGRDITCSRGRVMRDLPRSTAIAARTLDIGARHREIDG